MKRRKPVLNSILKKGVAWIYLSNGTDQWRIFMTTVSNSKGKSHPTTGRGGPRGSG